MIQKALIAFFSISLAACGGSSSSSGGAGPSGSGGNGTQDGRFVDSSVAGLDYVSEGREASSTDRNGTFRYNEAAPVTFSIGELQLGTTAGGSVLTPLDLVAGAREAQASGMSYKEIFTNFPAVLNIARFLQTIDVDLDAGNGLAIPPDARILISSYAGQIDFTDSEMFAADSSPAVEYICAVKLKRGQESCDASVVVSKESAAEELTKTEEAKASGAKINSLPSVAGGEDQTVLEGQNVALSGTANDSDGSIVRVEWFESDVNGIRKAGGIAIQGKDTLEATFTAPQVASDQLMYLALDVEDSDGGRATDIVHILVKNGNGNTDLLPTADAGSDQTVSPGSNVSLDGTGSSDPEGAIASYSWAQVDENGSVVTGGAAIQNANEAQASFVAPEVTENTVYIIRLTVTDSQAQSDSDLVNITVEVSSENAAPEANAGADQSVESGATVQLDGSGSSDADGDTLTYAWTQTEGQSVTLSDSASAMPTFDAPDVQESTTLSFALTVSDGQLQSTDTTSVTVAARASEFDCDPSSPETYGQCFAACQAGSDACPLPQSGGDFPPAGCSPDVFDAATCEASLRAMCAGKEMPAQLCEGQLPERPVSDGFTSQILFPNMLSDRSEGMFAGAPGLVVMPNEDADVVVSVRAFELSGSEYVARKTGLSLVVTTGDSGSQNIDKIFSASQYASVEGERVVFRVPVEELPQAQQSEYTGGMNGFVFTVNDNGNRNSRHFIPKEMMLYGGANAASLADALDDEYFTEDGQGQAFTPVIVLMIGSGGEFPPAGCSPESLDPDQCESSIRALCSSIGLLGELCESQLPGPPSPDGFTAQILFPNMLSDRSEGTLSAAPGLVIVPSDDGSIVVSVQAFEQVGGEYGVRTNDLSLVVTTNSGGEKTYNALDYASEEDGRVVFSIPFDELPQEALVRGASGLVFTVNDNGSRNSHHFVPKEMLLYGGSGSALLADALDGEYYAEAGQRQAFTPVIVKGFGLKNGGLEGEANPPVAIDPLDSPGLYRSSARDGSWQTAYRQGNMPIPGAGRIGSQAVTLFAINEAPTAWSVLGNVTAKAHWGTYFSDINKISFFYRTQKAGQQVGSDARFQIYMSLDENADGERDACVVSYLNDLRVGNTGGWKELVLDRNSGFGEEVTADCAGPSNKVPLAQLQLRYPNARVMSLSVQVVGSATPDAEMYVDDLSLQSIEREAASVGINDPSAQPEGGYSGSYKRSGPVFDETGGSVLQWDKDGAGMSYDVVVEPRHDFTAPVIRYQWRAAGCPANPQMPPSRVQPRAFIAREPAPDVYCSDSVCREKRGTYQPTVADDSALGGWNQFDWDGAPLDGAAPSGRAHLVAMIVDDLANCAVVQMRCIEVIGDEGSFHRAFWNDAQCDVLVSP